MADTWMIIVETFIYRLKSQKNYILTEDVWKNGYKEVFKFHLILYISNKKPLDKVKLYSIFNLYSRQKQWIPNQRDLMN